VSWVEAAHRRTAAGFERAAAAELRAAEVFDARGLALLAGGERERARRDRDLATVERGLAREPWLTETGARLVHSACAAIAASELWGPAPIFRYGLGPWMRLQRSVWPGRHRTRRVRSVHAAG
jgi:hypothetical protein